LTHSGAQSGPAITVQAGSTAFGYASFDLRQDATGPYTLTGTSRSPDLSVQTFDGASTFVTFLVHAEPYAISQRTTIDLYLGYSFPGGTGQQHTAVDVVITAAPPPPPSTPCYLVGVPENIAKIIKGDSRVQGILALLSREGVTVNWTEGLNADDSRTSLAVTKYINDQTFSIAVASDLDIRTKLRLEYLQDPAQVLFHELDHVRLEEIPLGQGGPLLARNLTGTQTVTLNGKSFTYSVGVVPLIDKKTGQQKVVNNVPQLTDSIGHQGFEHAIIDRDMKSVFGIDKTGAAISASEESDGRLPAASYLENAADAYQFFNQSNGSGTPITFAANAPIPNALKASDVSNLTCATGTPTTKSVSAPSDYVPADWYYLDYSPQSLASVPTSAPQTAQLTASNVSYKAVLSSTSVAIDGSFAVNLANSPDTSWISSIQIYAYSGDPQNPGRLIFVDQINPSGLFDLSGNAHVSLKALNLPLNWSGSSSFAYGFEVEAVAGDGSYLSFDLPTSYRGGSSTSVS